MDQAPDLLVIGAGIFGLWAARAARAAGLTVRVIEARRPGAGASGGPVGALSPHAPDRWNEKKAFQLASLLALPQRIAALEAETGRATGYGRIGRAQPLATPAQRGAAEARGRDAAARWPQGFTWEIRDRGPDCAAPEAGPAGWLFESLSARIDPRACLAALAQGLDIREAAPVAALPGDGRVRLADGSELAAGAVALAAGIGAWPLLGPRHGPDRGDGVKGQAALLRAGMDGPMVAGDGLYITPHEGGRVAIGSTSEKAFTDGAATDGALEQVIARARALVPDLRGAPVIERWAGVRPRAAGTEPLVGRTPGDPRLILALGGYKIGFGIAHAVGDIVAALAAGAEPPRAPAAFDPLTRLADASQPGSVPQP